MKEKKNGGESSTKDASEFSLAQNDMFNTFTGIIKHSRTRDLSSHPATCNG